MEESVNISAPRRSSFYYAFSDTSTVKQPSFTTLEHVDGSHYYHGTTSPLPVNPRSFKAAVMKDVKLLSTHLPTGIVVKGFQDRIVCFCYNLVVFSFVVIVVSGHHWCKGLVSDN